MEIRQKWNRNRNASRNGNEFLLLLFEKIYFLGEDYFEKQRIYIFVIRIWFFYYGTLYDFVKIKEADVKENIIS